MSVSVRLSRSLLRRCLGNSLVDRFVAVGGCTGGQSNS